MKQTLRPKHSQRSLFYLSGISIVVCILAFIVLKNVLSEYSNTGKVVISINQTMYFGTNFNNATLAYWQNEGELYFQKHLINDGEMSCGSCLSGVNYFNDEDEQTQIMGGSQTIKMNDVVLDNPGNLQLETELQIHNSLQFLEGDITSDLSDPDAFVHFKENTSYAGVNDAKHIVGYVGKTGDDSFVYPVGDGTRLHPIEIVGSSTTDFFKAAYFITSTHNTFPDGSTFRTDVKDDDIQSVYTSAFWAVEGSNTGIITMSWDSDDNMGAFVNDLSSLIISGWNGSKWVNLGKNNLAGDINTGSIQSDPLSPDIYQGFTFARENTGVLPLQWLDFQLETAGNNARLTWATAWEQGTDKFEIERSTVSGLAFEKLGELPASGNSTAISRYTFMDLNIVALGAKKVYYRLKQIDINGQFSYSKSLELVNQAQASQLQVSLFPNPAREYIVLDLQANKQSAVQLKIINGSGQTLDQQALQSGVQTRISLEHIPQGVYIFRLENEQGIANRKIVKR